MKVIVIVNRGGGSAAGAEDRIREAFEGTGVETDVRLVEPGELDRTCAEVAEARGVDALVAAGGDGTISTAAGAVASGSVQPRRRLAWTRCTLGPVMTKSGCARRGSEELLQPNRF